MREWQQVRKLLAVRADAMGDVLMTTPALRAIKESLPETEVTLLTSSAGAGVGRLVPEVDRVWEGNLPWVKQEGAMTVLEEYIDQVEREKFDALIVFTVYSQSALPAAMLGYLAKIPLRLGYNHENPYQLLTEWVPDPEPQVVTRHEVERQLALVGRVGYQTQNKRLGLEFSRAAQRSAGEALAEIGVEAESDYIVVHPGVSEERRRYPIGGFAQAAREWTERLKVPIVVSGSREEEGWAQEVAAALPKGGGGTLAGKLTVEVLAAVIDGAGMLLSNNSGPVHMAASRGTPVVDVYATTNLQHTPWMVASRVLYFDTECKDCQRGVCGKQHSKVKRWVKPENIVEVGIELWQETKAQRGQNDKG